ncbi:MAG: DUF1631 family protein, partial [Rubrivivax sp.]
MVASASSDSLAGQARRVYTEELVKGLVPLVQTAIDGSRELLEKPSEHAVAQRRRDLVQRLMAGAQAWHRAIVVGLRTLLQQGGTASRAADLPPAGGGRDALTLVPDDTIELEIVTSRLALAIQDRASWEFSDLRSRIAHLEGRNELDPHDMLRAHVLARIVFESWLSAGLSLEGWRELQPVLHDEFALIVEESYHETNRWLVEHGVLAEVDLRPFIRRSRTHPNAPLGWRAGTGADMLGRDSQTGGFASGFAGGGSGGGGSSGAVGYAGRGVDDGHDSQQGPGGWHGSRQGDTPGQFVERRGRHAGGESNPAVNRVGEETRLMTRSAPLARSRDHAEAVMGRLNRLVG